MTTKIRIEKADQYPVPVMVQEQQVNAEGKWVNNGDPVMLVYAAQQTEQFVHANKRYIVYEAKMGNA